MLVSTNLICVIAEVIAESCLSYCLCVYSGSDIVSVLSKGLINKQQRGFISKYSTAINLFVMLYVLKTGPTHFTVNFNFMSIY